jgi:hypothetical protein
MADEPKVGHATENMKNNIIGALDGLRTWGNLYVATFGLSILAMITTATVEEKRIEILDIPVQRHHVSLLFGILFLIFISVLYFRINLLKTTVKSHGKRLREQSGSELITLYPWIASPFHHSRRVAVTFWVFVGAGLGYVAWLAIWHYTAGFGTVPKEIADCYFRFVIGSVDVVAFLSGSAFTFFIAKDIREIKEHLDYSEAE